MPAFHVSRSMIIRRSTEEVFDTVADFNTWTSWSPWLGIDPKANVSIKGNGSSPGSIYQWNGDVVGTGETEHIRLNRPTEIHDEIRFVKPFRSLSKVHFTLSRVGEGTKLTWQMEGSLPWFLFWMRSSMETFVGMDYERGLKMLRDRIEKGKVLSRIEVVGVEQRPAVTVCGVRDSCSSQDMAPVMQKAIGEAKSGLSVNGVTNNGEMISVYHRADLKRGVFDFTIGFTVPEQDVPKLTGLTRCRLAAGRALHLRHIGSYDHLGNAWSGAYQFARYRKLKLAKAEAYEVYRNDPAETPEAEWITDIYLPVR